MIAWTFGEFPAATSPAAAKTERGAADSGEVAALSSLAARVHHSSEWWYARLEAMNAETARLLFRDSRLMLWIALAASWAVDLVWRAL